jgi:Cu/Ag efflux protein CusF
MLKRLLLIALFVIGSTVLYAQSSGSGSGTSGTGDTGSTQGTQDQPGMSGDQGTQQDQPGSSTGSTTGDQSGTGSTTSDQSGTSNTGSGGNTGGTSDQGTTNKMITGTISKIDKDDNTITIKDETTKESQKYTLSSTATMTKDGSSITQSQLKKGDHVSVEVDSQNNVTKIDVMSKSSSNPPGESKH